MLLWGYEAERTSLVELSIHPGTKVQVGLYHRSPKSKNNTEPVNPTQLRTLRKPPPSEVVSTAELTLSCVGRLGASWGEDMLDKVVIIVIQGIILD